MKALITGGTGYFGSVLLSKLLERGCKVSVFDINKPDSKYPDFGIFQGDIRNYNAIEKACKGMDIVYHNVAQVPLAKDKALFETVNVHGTENLLKAALEARVKKVVYTSSSAVFGAPKANPVTEETKPRPGEAYGRTKYKGENLCEQYIHKGLDVSIIRPRTIMGHGRLGIFQILFEWIYQGANIPVLGKGNNTYQFVHADDLAEGCLLASLNPGPAVYNLGASEYGSMREVLENLCEHAGTGSRVKGIPLRPAVMGMRLTQWLKCSPLGTYHALMYGRSFYFDISKAKKELNWDPHYSNNAMFTESYDAYLKTREKILTRNRRSHHQSAVKEGILKAIKWIL